MGLDAQIGQEDTPEQYIDRLTAVLASFTGQFRKDGTLWLNIADTPIAGTGNKGGYADPKNPKGRTGQRIAKEQPRYRLQAKGLNRYPLAPGVFPAGTGWYLRSDIIWQKQNPSAGKLQRPPYPLL